MLQGFVDWFSGGTEFDYMTGIHCMDHDWTWIVWTIILNFLVLIGYIAIALHWRKNEKTLPAGPAKTALNRMKYIFLFCGLCGYSFTIIRMWWPVWRLADMALVFLIYFTYMYVFKSGGLNVVYSDLKKKQALEDNNVDLVKAKDDLEKLTVQLKITIEKMNATNRELTRSNTELEQFAYVASHDLKAPLRAVNNLAGWVQEDFIAGKPVEENIQKMRTRIAHMDSLINGLLEYSRIGRQHVEKAIVNVSDMLANSVALSATDNVKITVKNPLPPILANPVRLEQVFSNLITNAIKHNDKPQVEIEISCRDAGRFHEFCVSDNGPGIEPRFHQKIFVIFQSLKPGTGTGIGLTLVQKIIKDFGGDIWVESDLGKGAKFFFTVPK